MFRISALILCALAIQMVTSPAFSPAFNADNSLTGLSPAVAFNMTAFYNVTIANIASLTALNTVAVTVSAASSLYTILSNMTQTMGVYDVANFNTFTAHNNMWNQFFSTVKQFDDSFKRRYAAWTNNLNTRLNAQRVITMYNALLPNITVVNAMVGNITVTDLSFNNNMTIFNNNFWAIQMSVNQTLNAIANLNTFSQQVLSNEIFNINNNLSAFVQNQTSRINPILDALVAQINTYASYITNYTLGVQSYLGSIVQTGLNNIINHHTLVTNITTLVNTFATGFPQNITNITDNITSALNTLTTNNVNELTGIFAATATSYNTLWHNVNTLNGLIQGMAYNLPLLVSEFNWANQLLAWAQSKANYDFTNLLNYQLIFTAQINNLLASFDSMIIAENHFNDNILPTPVNAFAFFSSTFTFGQWTLDVAANFPGSLTTAQAARCVVYSTVVFTFNTAITNSNITAVTMQNLDPSYSSEAYMGYLVNSTAVYGYVAVADPIATSGLLQINVEFGAVLTGTSAVNQFAPATFGTASLLSNYSPFFTQRLMGPTGAVINR